MRRHAAHALAQLDALTSEAAPALISLLKGEAWQTRFRAARALEQMGAGASAVIPDAIALLRDDRNATDARVEAAQVLGVIGGASPETAPALLSALQDDDWWVRLYAARALGEREATEAVTALADRLQDANVDVRRSATLALSQFQADAVEAVPTLVAALEDPVIGGAAAEALAKVGPRVLSFLGGALKDETGSHER